MGWWPRIAAAVGVMVVMISVTRALTPDGLVLLEVKDGLIPNNTENQQSSMLKDWNASDENPCNWTGITCHPHHFTVRSIDLPYMLLDGTISSSIGKLPKLHRLALHGNKLKGKIPAEIANCTEIRAIYLRKNHLQGTIPPAIGHLTQLVILDLSSNSLTGSIPSTFGFISHLRVLNLSTNYLSGEIPYFGALATFQNTSFMGNRDLCGHPVIKTCRKSLGFPAVLPQSDESTPAEISKPQSRKSSHYFSVAIICLMSVMGVGVVVLLFFLWICLLSGKSKRGQKYIKVNKQRAQDAGIKFISFHGDLPYLSSDISKKLELLNEEDVVGSGGYGTVYKMVMDDNNAFSVKRIDRSCEVSDKVFENELQILGGIKHNNIVIVRGYCRLPSDKFIIYDYFTLGSLYQYLHEHGQGEQALNWNSRLRIAFGCARGLAYLHHDCYPQIVHGNIKSSNILLDRSLEPHVSDFGLSRCLAYNDGHITTIVAGSFGYFAPEYLNNGVATEKTDVYSFGIVLLELITGKKPTDMLFFEKGLNIVGWMSKMTKENLLEAIDQKCEYPDPDAVEVVLDIAAMCTDPNPHNRPCMSRVLKMLEEAMNPSSCDFYEQLDI